MNKNEQSAGTKDEQRTTAESGTSAGLVQNGMLSDAGQEGNKMIAEFMDELVTHTYESFGKRYTGTIHPKNIKDWTEVFMPYDLSWNKLMPAWKKFSDLKFIDNSVTAIHLNYCARITHALAATDIYTAHKHLVNGIKWYNAQINKSA